MHILAQDVVVPVDKALVVKYEVEQSEVYHGEIHIADRTLLVKDLKYQLASQINLAALKQVINLDRDTVSLKICTRVVPEYLAVSDLVPLGCDTMRLKVSVQ